jgi:hypothetical protein
VEGIGTFLFGGFEFFGFGGQSLLVGFDIGSGFDESDVDVFDVSGELFGPGVEVGDSTFDSVLIEFESF